MNSSDALHAWCERWLGAAPRRIIFELRQLSQVVGLELADGRSVVVKVRPPARRLVACALAQHHLWSCGYPCPEPLAGPLPLGSQMASAETYLPDGAPRPGADCAPQPFAAALADLVARAPDPAALPALDPSPPWVGWDHDQPVIWPLPDNLDADLNAAVGPAWLDDAGHRVRTVLLGTRLPAVVGHADWESQNLCWDGGRLAVVHDWDSVVALPEAMIAGAASAVFTADRRPLSEPAVDESDAFLAAYERARGQPWHDDERRAAWAAGLWVRAFNAKKAFVRDPTHREIARLESEVAARLARAHA